MSGFSSAALPGKIPTSGSGRNISPDALPGFFPDASRGFMVWPYNTRIKAVKVRTFDLSDDKQRKEYERLQAKLIERALKGEVRVDDSRKDLVHRADGTSYWMKYVEYIELGAAAGDSKDGGKK